MNYTSIAVCSFLNGSEGNAPLKWLLDLHRDTLPNDFIHPCPYFGIFAADNITIIPHSWMPQFFSGEYKSSLRIYDRVDDNIFTFLSETDISYSNNVRKNRKKKI